MIKDFRLIDKRINADASYICYARKRGIFFTKFLEAFNFLIAACKQLSRSVQGIFGPSDPLLGAHIQSICEALDVPHLEARVDFEPTFKEFSINLYPAQDHLNKAFKDLMFFLNWTRVAIIYEEDYGKSSISVHPTVAREIREIAHAI